MALVSPQDLAQQRLWWTPRQTAPRLIGRRHAMLSLVGGIVLLASPRFIAQAYAVADLRPLRCPETECGYLYDPAIGDPDGGIPPGVAFENLPEDWECPECGTPKALW